MKPRFPRIRITTNGNQLVSDYTEARIMEGGVFYPITPSTEMGENYQLAFAEGKLDVFGRGKIAIETEGEHAAQGGAIALSVTGKALIIRRVTELALNPGINIQDADRIRDSRGMPGFVFDPSKEETYPETLDLKGNPMPTRDWAEIKSKGGRTYDYTVTHWAATEARFRQHFKRVTDTAGLIPLDEILLRVSQDDITQRHVLDPDHFAFVPRFGVYLELEDEHGKVSLRALSRKLVLLCVERRRSWRLLQSRAGIENPDYKAQRAVRAVVDGGELDGRTVRDLFTEELERVLLVRKRRVRT